MPPRIKSKLHQRIGERVKELRLDKNMSQKELALKLQLKDYQLVGYMEQGKRPPTVEDLIILRRVFKVSFNYLITGGD